MLLTPGPPLPGIGLEEDDKSMWREEPAACIVLLPSTQLFSTPTIISVPSWFLCPSPSLFLSRSSFPLCPSLSLAMSVLCLISDSPPFWILLQRSFPPSVYIVSDRRVLAPSNQLSQFVCVSVACPGLVPPFLLPPRVPSSRPSGGSLCDGTTPRPRPHLAPPPTSAASRALPCAPPADL